MFEYPSEGKKKKEQAIVTLIKSKQEARENSHCYYLFESTVQAAVLIIEVTGNFQIACTYCAMCILTYNNGYI